MTPEKAREAGQTLSTCLLLGSDDPDGLDPPNPSFY